MLIFENGDSVDIIYEVYSALGTVGLSRDYTPEKIKNTVILNTIFVCREKFRQTDPSVFKEGI